MKILGCGIDIIDIQRVNKYLGEYTFDFPFKESVFTKSELKHVGLADANTFFPISFSCKEAVFKAFGVSWTHYPLEWSDVEWGSSNKNLPQINLYGYFLKRYNEMKINKINFDFHYPEKDLLFFKVILLS